MVLILTLETHTIYKLRSLETEKKSQQEGKKKREKVKESKE